MKIKNIQLKQTIGMRVIKTALAVTIGLYLSMLFNLNSPIFTSIASITSMKPSFAESFKDVKKRMFSSIFGVSLGFILSNVPVDDYIKPFIAGFGIILVIYILQVFHMKEMSLLSSIVFTASFLSKSDKLIYGVNRIIGTFLGIIIGVTINYLISSPNIYEDFLNSARKTTDICLKTCEQLFLSTKDFDFYEFERAYTHTEEIYELLLLEIDTPFHGEINLKLSTDIIKLLTEIYLRLHLINNISKEPDINEDNRQHISDLYKYTILYSGNLSGDLNTVYNYHINIIFKNINELQKLIGVNNGKRRKQVNSTKKI